MINSKNIDVNEIIKKTIGEIGSSRYQVLAIVENLRNDQQNLKLELAQIRKDIGETIDEVDVLEKEDKIMRQKLVEVSKNFHDLNENEIKAIYDNASNIRIKFILKKNEEKALKERRYRLEVTLKKLMESIESAEKIMSQIGIALAYLEGNDLSAVGEADKNSEMCIGIRILEAQENERKRIARDIHDGPAQYMANVIMKMDICKRVIQEDLTEGLKELSSLKESVKVALKEVRDTIFDLRPMPLDSLGLNQIICEIAKSIIKEAGIEIDLKLRPMEIAVEPIIQVAVYRIIQEIFNNIRKHSKAKHVELKLDFGTEYLVLIVCDDGIGFDVEETLQNVKAKGTSYGLIGVLDRVNQLQGEINIESSKEKGAIYKVKLPVSREVIRCGNKKN